MFIGPRAETRSSEKPRYGVGSGSTEMVDGGATVVEREVLWGPRGIRQLFGVIFRGSVNFLDEYRGTLLPDGRGEEFVGSGG